MKKWIFILTVLGFLSFSGKAFGFTLSVTPTHETCSQNGALTFNITNPDPGGSITYLVYLLPNTSTPFATLNTNFLGGLSAGTYRVIATETVGTTSTQQQVDVTVNDNTVLLAYNVQILNQACASTSNIIVNVTQGAAVSYEIFSGPVTFPLQSSNTFSGLPVGQYNIRVFDACGNGIPQTFTVTLNPTGLTIGAPVFTNTVPASCTATVVTNTITPAPGTVIAYPLAIQYTVFPPGGGTPIVTNTNLASGNATSQPISTTIPSYGNQSYSYEVQVSDACGGPPFAALFPINPAITLVATTVPISCNQNYFNLLAGNFTPPYTLNFTAAPAGFNPAAFNAQYPGPFTNALTTFGSSTQAAPIGNYTVEITDACGRTRTSTFNVLDLPPVPVGTGTNNGCLTNSGQIVISIPNYEVVTAIITATTATNYPFPLPHNVTASIDANHILTLNPVPLGIYTFQLTNECGDTIPPFDVTVPVYVDQGLASAQRPGCELNKGSVRISSLNGRLASVTITAAPAGFATPFNASFNIAAVDGVFYMNNLDAGSYTFQGVDECNFTNSITVVVDGYFASGTFSLVANCGSFNLPLAYTSNGVTNETYWLQKQIDATADTWGHPGYPGVGAIYTNGTVPTTATGVALINNTNNLNQSYNGTFRIVRSFSSYNNGSALNAGTVTTPNRNCIEYLSPTMSFNQSLEIVDVNRMSCTPAGTLDIVVTALGSTPIHYYLLDGAGTLLVDNGNSNIFTNVQPGVYIIRIEDPCGGIRSTVPFDVSTLLSLVTITQPDPILLCRTNITGAETFDLTTQNATILGAQSPTDYTLTYHTSLANAQAGVGAIVGSTQNAFNPATNPQTMYARVVFNQLPNCYEVTSFDLVVGQTPRINLNPEYLSCTTVPITLDASVGNIPGLTTYLWSDGDTNPVKVITALGVTNLTVVATNSYGAAGFCDNPPYPVTVTISRPPTIEGIQTTDWTDYENTITILSSNSAAYEYSLDGNTFQDDNTFYNLIAGLYTVTIRDKAGCGTLQKIVWLLNYPKFFTPNGDGINETWYIKNQQFEPDFTVEVYDRYGKLIKSFKSNTMGWDGTYNGAQNFSTDYWFVVHRQDGRIHRGHFTLKR